MTDPRSALAAFIRFVTRDSTFRRCYAARVERDNGDSTVDLVADDDAVRGIGMQKIPVLSGIAGTSSQVNPGTRCLLGFAGGDPRHPRVVAWEYQQGSAVVSLDGGTAPVARFADVVNIEVAPLLPISGIASGVLTTPHPTELPPATLDVDIPGVPFALAAVVVGPLSGIVQTGNPKVLA